MERLIGKTIDNYYESYAVNQDVFRKLYDYEDAEEQGLLLRLPCKVGDVIYTPLYGTIIEYTITSIHFEIRETKKIDLWFVTEDNKFKITGRFYISEIGKIVFLTREEAEAKLEELRGEK